MMSKLSENRTQFLSTLYDKVNSHSLQWRSHAENSYSTNIDEYRIDVDKRTVGNKSRIVVWVFGEDGQLVDRVYDHEAEGTSTSLGGVNNFQELIAKIYTEVENDAGGHKLTDVIEKLSRFPRSDDDPNEDLLA